MSGRRRQCRRHADRHARRYRWHRGRRGQFIRERARRLTEQIGEAIERLLDLLIVLGQLRLGLRVLRCRTFYIELTRESHLRLTLRQRDDIALLIDEALGNLPQCLGAPQLHIGLRDLGLERHQCVVAAFHRLFGLRMRGLDRTAYPAEQIQLP
jgi:hypothetical protein